MNMVRAYLAAASILAAMVSVSCDHKPSPLKTADGQPVKFLAVSEADPAEQSAALAMETARVDYLYRLQVLQGYYNRTGNLDKYNWTKEEIENLATAHTFTWQGVPKVDPPAGESIESADEMMLVEYLVGARNAWDEAARGLQGHYEASGQSFKAAVIKNMRDRLDPVRQYMYYVNAEIPSPDLRPTEVNPQAEALFANALKLHESGKIAPGIINYNKQRQALGLFLELVRKYPASTRIALSAYYIADIYKEFFNEDVRAVHWYERSWQWDPTVPKPARFQAAVVWDHRLHNRGKAVEVYRLVVKDEQLDSSHIAYARDRIAELTKK